MSGDYSRWSFEPWRDFGAVLGQQGRVHTDADWNEWVSIVLRRLQAETVDALGRAVVPSETPDGFRIQAAGGGLTIGLGRAYVDGLLAENHGDPRAEWHPVLAELRGNAAIAYDKQPYYPGAPALPGGGPHLAYLRVWQREIGHVEQPSIVEKALGIDTTARLQTAWQVRLVAVPAGTDCGTPLTSIPAFVDAEPAAAGRLSSRTAEVPGQPDPCDVPAGGGYTGVENQLYRVEIHRGGPIGGANGATFKWSRDNATVASRVLEIPTSLDRIVVDSIGRDDVLALHDGDWIEITDDVRELAGQPGEMRRIKVGGGVDETTNTVLLAAPLTAGTFPVDAQGRTIPTRNTRVRRWDQGGRVFDANGNELTDLSAGADGTIKIPTGATEVLLESGIVVRFRLDPTTGRFRTGDHWLIAARTVDGSVEELDKAPPRGVHAHYAPLALVTFPGTVEDCRTVFPPLGGLDALEYVAGDGQEVTPNLVTPAPVPLPVDPTVGVARGPIPVGGRTVRFTIEAGSGTIDGGAGPVVKATGLDGLASVDWSLDPGTTVQRLLAELLDQNGQPTSLPVRFTARLRIAAEVAYDPKACPDLAGVTTVQEAIDNLCGRTDHGDCCATVGKGGDFPDLRTAIEELQKRHDGHVCICLLPGRHRFEGDRFGGFETLTIGGRGAVVELGSPFQPTEIRSILIRDVTFEEGAEQLPSLLSVALSERVEIEAVSAVARRLAEDGAVVQFEQCADVRLDGCQVLNRTKVRRTEEPELRERLPGPFREVVLLGERSPGSEESRAFVNDLLGLPQAERDAAAAELDALIAANAATIGARDMATFERMSEFVRSAEALPPARLRDLLARFGRVGGRLTVGDSRSAVAFADGGGDAWLVSNRFEGGIKLYPGRRSIDAEQRLEKILRGMPAGTPDFLAGVPGGGGTLRASDNQLDWIAPGEEMAARLFETFETGHAPEFGFPVFNDQLLHGNTFRGGPQAIVAETVAMSSNTLLGEAREALGFAYATAATLTGNIGPSHESPFVAASAHRGVAANTRILVVP